MGLNEKLNNIGKYTFKHDFIFNNDIYNVGIENTSSWEAKKGWTVFGFPSKKHEGYLTILISPGRFGKAELCLIKSDNFEEI